MESVDGIFSDIPGVAKGVEMSIDTGDSEPVSQHPYSVPLSIRDNVKVGVDKARGTRN